MTTRNGSEADQGNTRLGSTTLEWRLRKISRPPEGHKHSGAKRHRWYHLPKLAWETPVRMRVTLKGGAMPWLRVEARGGVAFYRGDEALVDVLAAILNQQEAPRG